MKLPKVLQDNQPDMFRQLLADCSYTILTFKNGSSVISDYNLSFYENLFRGKGFVRIDRSNLVKRLFIACQFTDESDNYIQLCNDNVLQIPRRRKTELFRQIRLRCEGSDMIAYFINKKTFPIKNPWCWRCAKVHRKT